MSVCLSVCLLIDNLVCKQINNAEEPEQERLIKVFESFALVNFAITYYLLWIYYDRATF